MIEAAWLTIERALAALEPPVGGELAPGASDEDIAALGSALPIALPQELETSLRAHDGMGTVHLDDLPRLLSAREIGEQYAALTEGVPGAQGQVPFDPSWVPFQVSGGVWTCVAPRVGRSGFRLVGVSVEEPEPFEIEGTYGLRLEDAAAALEALVPSAPEAAGPSSWAMQVIEELVKNEELELATDADCAELAIRMERAAVGAMSSNPRVLAEKILDALVDAPQVEEVFADRKAILLALDV